MDNENFAKLNLTLVKALKEKVREIENMNNELDTIVEKLPACILIVDRNKKIRKANEFTLKLTGHTAESEMIGKVCHDCICPAEEGKCPILDLGQNVDKSRKIVLTKDGRNIPVLKSVIPIVLNKKEVLLEVFIEIPEKGDLKV